MKNTVLNDDSLRIKRIYSGYRIIALFLMGGLFLLDVNDIAIGVDLFHRALFWGVLIVYLTFSAGQFLFIVNHQISERGWLMTSGLLDILLINCLIAISGDIKLGVLLSVSVAAQSILAPGLISMAYAASASLMLLGITGVQVLFFSYDSENFFYAGILGAGLFATALTALYLANVIRLSKQQALLSSDELASLQKINAYIVDRLYSGLVFVDSVGKIKLVNVSAIKLFSWYEGKAPEGLKELSMPLFLKFEQWIKHQKYYEASHREIFEQPNLLVNFLPIQCEEDTDILIVIEDLSRYLKEAQQLKLASLGRFTASIAHEIRNPLGAISHASQLLLESESCNEIDLKLIKIINKNCTRMDGFIKNILQLSRRKAIQAETILIKPFLDKFRHEFCESFSSDFMFSVNVVPETLKILFDKEQLYQILNILADNSIKHSQVGSLKIEIEVMRKAEKIVLLFRDNGVGVKSNPLSSIFEPFYTSSRNGVGMGLFIAKELCEINQASLTVEQVNSGACFTLTFKSEDTKLL